jgi:hypothetical protein
MGFVAAPARSAPDSEAKLDPRRFELAGLPIVGGNTDIGVNFGGATSLTRFRDEARPYLWKANLVLSVSLKDTVGGVRFVQQNYLLRLDAPDLLNGRLRVDERLSFQRTINDGYYGIGDVSRIAPPSGRLYQYLREGLRDTAILRLRTGTPIDVAVGIGLRYEDPTRYSGSRLAEDSVLQNLDGSPFIRGLSPMFLGRLAGGIIYDTRDTEFVTTRGLFYQIGLAGSWGSADGILYGEAAAVLSHYAPIAGTPLILAGRLVTSFQLGQVPFYDLAQGGPFESQSLAGGDSGIRGVPLGRYAGLVKVIANMELRSTFPRFIAFGQRLRLGTTMFVDTGRVWSDYSPTVSRDGRGMGIKYGVGGGVFLEWGEAAIFRVEAAYSPDAVAENPGFPVGIYVADGLMF